MRDWHPGLQGGQAPEDLDPAEIRHPEIHEGQVEGLRLGAVHALLAPADRAHLIALAPQHLGQEITHHGIVVGHEQDRGGRHAMAPTTGSRTAKCCRNVLC